MEFELEVPVSYDLLSSVKSWIFPEIQPVPEVIGDNNFGRIFSIGSKQIPIMLTQKYPGNSIQINTMGKGVRRKAVQKKMEQVLGFSVNLEAAFEEMKRDKVLAPISEAVTGIRPYSTDTLFEALIKAIIQQQISYKAANVITKRLVESVSKPSSGLYQFPDYKSILDFGLDGMKSIGFGYKIPYIHNICEMIKEGTLILDSLSGRSYDEVSEILLPIKGIGEWTVQALAISYLSDFSVFPFGDLVIQNVLGNLFNNGKRMSKAEVITFSKSFGKVGPLVLNILMSANVLGFVE